MGVGGPDSVGLKRPPLPRSDLRALPLNRNAADHKAFDDGDVPSAIRLPPIVTEYRDEEVSTPSCYRVSNETLAMSLD